MRRTLTGAGAAMAAFALTACATTEAGTVTMEEMPMKPATSTMVAQAMTAPTPVTKVTSAPDRIAMNAVVERATGKSLMVPRTAFRDSPDLMLDEPGAPGRDTRMPSDMVTHNFRLVKTNGTCALVYTNTGEVFPLDGVVCD